MTNKNLQTTEYSICSVDYSLDNQWLALGTSNLTNSIWDGKIILFNDNADVKEKQYDVDSGITGVQWLNNDILVFSTDDSRISFININHSNQTTTPITITKTQDYIEDDFKNRGISQHLCCHSHIISSIDIFENKLLSSSWDKSIKLWDINSSDETSLQLSNQFIHHYKKVNIVKWNRINRDLFASGSDNGVVVGDCRDKHSSVFNKETQIPVYSLAWATNNDYTLYTGHSNGQLIQYDIRNTTEIIKKPHSLAINQIHVNSKYISTVSDDRSSKVFDINNTDTLVYQYESNDFIKCITSKSDSTNQFITGSIDKKLVLHQIN
ncbi:hypothetical protein CYY_003493 [Polysphondylium violaceum]|uniref:WD40 repeat-containing protein n=1 Tax=Polysphondylium violaceum TaxID=133409 RepID=A0A8J4PW98_9MYCE|nr:hypothetical protein CYY_003493 [Polysphondylium violaceum]